MVKEVTYIGDNFFEGKLDSLNLKIGREYSANIVKEEFDLIEIIKENNTREYYSLRLFINKE